MKFFLLLGFFISHGAFATAYFGGSYGYNTYNSNALEKYNVKPKGYTYGGFLGIGKDFVGLELIYQNLETSSKIKHDGAKHTINESANAMGAALRFSFNKFYVRMGMALFNLDQSVEVADTTSRRTAEDIYEIQEKGSDKSGGLYGVGLHTKVKSSRVFLDYTRYQISSVGNYDTVSVGISFNLPDSFLGGSF